MISSFAELLIQLHKDYPDAYDDLLGVMRSEEGAKGETLIRINSVCKNVYILATGLVRHYRYDEEGKEFNTWFSFEGDVVMPMRSFIIKSPSKEGVELLEDCTYNVISNENLFSLTKKHHALETMYRQLLEMYYIEMEDRMYRIQAYNAEKKYNYLLTQKHHILERIPQLHVASYIGISRETLSRIRAKQRNV